MSKMKYYKEAEMMYVEDKLTIDEISIQLDVSRRTLFYWKKKYEWDRKRFETQHNQEIFSEELLGFVKKLMQKISKDVDNKVPTSQSEIYSLMNILKNIPQVKEYESSIKTQKSKSQKTLSPEFIIQIQRDILGF